MVSVRLIIISSSELWLRSGGGLGFVVARSGSGVYKVWNGHVVVALAALNENQRFYACISN